VHHKVTDPSLFRCLLLFSISPVSTTIPWRRLFRASTFSIQRSSPEPYAQIWSLQSEATITCFRMRAEIAPVGCTGSLILENNAPLNWASDEIVIDEYQNGPVSL